MSKHDLLKTQTCVLRVNIDCDGCKSKVKKTLQKIDDVYVTSIDMQQGKVTVTGNVDPAVLIKKLEKSGKHATVWSTEKGNSNKNKNGHEFDNVNDQLKKLLQGGSGKGGGGDFKKFELKGGKEQPKGGNGGGDGKNLQQINFQQFLEQMKSGSKDFTMKDQKPVKVNNFPGKGDDHDFEDFSGDDEFDDDDDDYDDDDDFDDEEDDEFDDDEDDYDDDDEEEEDDDEEELGYDDGKHHKQHKITIPIMVNDLGKEKKGSEKGKKSGSGDGKKSGGFMSMIGKAMGGNNEGKDGKGGKKGWGGEIGGKKQSGEGKNNGGSPKNGGEGKNGNKGGGGGGGGGGKKGGANKIGSLKDLDVPSHKGGGGGGMGQMGQYQMGPVGHTAPMMNMNGGGSGYYQGMGPMAGNPYQQQQYMAMMMNQQRMNGGGGMYHPAMYGPPPPGYGYVPPPPVYRDNVTHMFSDENPGGCSIM